MNRKSNYIFTVIYWKSNYSVVLNKTGMLFFIFYFYSFWTNGCLYFVNAKYILNHIIPNSGNYQNWNCQFCWFHIKSNYRPNKASLDHHVLFPISFIFNSSAKWTLCVTHGKAIPSKLYSRLNVESWQQLESSHDNPPRDTKITCSEDEPIIGIHWSLCIYCIY
jgi:hypothetical protein